MAGINDVVQPQTGAAHWLSCQSPVGVYSLLYVCAALLHTNLCTGRISMNVPVAAERALYADNDDG